MPRYPDFETEAGIARRLAEGRGQGTGPNYKPYITRFDFSSRGQRRETYCHKCRRSVHLMSKLEYQHFLVANFDERVVDIREQYPLPRDETRGIARALEIVHPRSRRTKVDLVVTTDLLLTVKAEGGGTHQVAWSDKYENEVSRKRVSEKLLIEKAWHELHGEEWHLKTDKGLDRRLISNLNWVHYLERPNVEQSFEPELVERIRTELERRLQSSDQPLHEEASLCDAEIDECPRGASLFLARMFLARKIWRADLSAWDRASQPLKLLK